LEKEVNNAIGLGELVITDILEKKTCKCNKRDIAADALAAVTCSANIQING